MLIVTDHDSVDYVLVGKRAKLIIDTRNAMARKAAGNSRVIKA
ncbi:MAG TPA: hypothetical protein VMT54_10310 [Candidatus Cybelea sp.]|nr:hypothetical protein [Candidatus Cybelea sp.]